MDLLRGLYLCETSAELADDKTPRPIGIRSGLDLFDTLHAERLLICLGVRGRLPELHEVLSTLHGSVGPLGLDRLLSLPFRHGYLA